MTITRLLGSTWSNKNQVSRQNLQYFREFVFRQFNAKVKIIKSINGLEFYMSDNYASWSIFHQTSCVETLQQNEIVEKKHQTHSQCSSSLEIQAKLPLNFGEIVCLLSYLISRTPTPQLLNKRPYELFFLLETSYSHLRFLDVCVMPLLSHNHS